MRHIAPQPATQPAGVGFSTTPSTLARARMLREIGEPLLLADWVDVLMVHLEVDPDALQPDTPFELDLYEGRAFVSLVAFTMRRMRPRVGGRLAAWLFRPLATHPFLNVRTYVRHQDEVGIHFLAEWVPNPWSLRLAPRSFGLPYRLGRLEYGHRFNGAGGAFAGTVVDAKNGSRFCYEGAESAGSGNEYSPCDEGSLEEWLMERYTAFTHVPEQAPCSVRSIRLAPRYFRVWHPPWRRTPVRVTIRDRSLLTSAWPWMAEATIVAASGSPGFQDVWMSRPRWIASQGAASMPC